MEQQRERLLWLQVWHGRRLPHPPQEVWALPQGRAPVQAEEALQQWQGRGAAASVEVPALSEELWPWRCPWHHGQGSDLAVLAELVAATVLLEEALEPQLKAASAVSPAHRAPAT